MNLQALLDTLRQDYLHDRSDRVSGDTDQLWSDTTLCNYISAAQRRFARRSLCIQDGTSAVTRIVTQPLQQDYTLDPSILTVKSVRNMGNGAYIGGTFLPGTISPAVGNTPAAFTPAGVGVLAVYPQHRDMVRVSHEMHLHVRDEPFFDVNSVGTWGPGLPWAYETDETVAESNGSSGVVSLHLRPMPSAAYAGCVLQMRVTRLPLQALTPQDREAVPEIPEDYHLDLLDYAAHLALRIVDHELGDPQRAAEFGQMFERKVQEARQELARKTFQPMAVLFTSGNYQGN